MARTSPDQPSVALPGGSTESEPSRDTATPAAPKHRSADDPAESIIARAQEEYDKGVEALQAGDSDEARARFDAALQCFQNAGISIDQNARLKAAYEKMADDIASLESEFEEAPDVAPDAVPSPTEELKDIQPKLSPEDARKELEKVGPEANQVSFDIPMVVNEQVLAWVDIFRNRKDFRESFLGGYQRYGWYEEMIHRILKEEGLPSDLIYMAFMESTYKTSAYSRARAKGIWQFMTPTGREYGLKVNRFVDERSNPEKSTRAAARYMKDLYAMLGDWHLAIAAYNTGAGNIMRAQRRSGKTDYWDLAKTRYMRTETKNFVPAILALALLSKDPAKYGFEGLEHNATLRYDRVTVDGPTDLSLVARLAGCTTDELKFLNPQLRLGVTPPGEKGYELLVPEGRGETFMAAYAAVPDSDKFARVAKVHTVRRGETLASIASRYGTTVGDLKATNNIRGTRLAVGSQLSVPNVSGPDPDADAPRSARRAGSKYSPYHVVRRGDTLSGISRSYGVSMRNLLAWNNISESTVLMPGTRLVVGRDASGSTTGGAGRPVGALRPVAPAAGLVSVPGGGQAPPDPAGAKVLYKVRSGDNLFRIALKFGTTVENLKAWNSIVSDSIRAGAVLTIYPN